MEARKTCDACHIGTLHSRRTTYTYWSDDDFVVLPNVMVWVCDVCGDVVYETEAIMRLQLLLGSGRTAMEPEHTLRLIDHTGNTSVAASRRRSV